MKDPTSLTMRRYSMLRMTTMTMRFYHCRHPMASRRQMMRRLGWTTHSDRRWLRSRKHLMLPRFRRMTGTTALLHRIVATPTASRRQPAALPLRSQNCHSRGCHLRPDLKDLLVPHFRSWLCRCPAPIRKSSTLPRHCPRARLTARYPQAPACHQRAALDRGAARCHRVNHPAMRRYFQSRRYPAPIRESSKLLCCRPRAKLTARCRQAPARCRKAAL